ncbi:tripartite tricarboxylate transporter TctB family protein [Alteribacillus iranensis]|uniref:Tripartite tricarboxylate transporter TctB family protein n=1 Tax=Alteribacillus iranensis TaxID=930128 RepID=A0A1I2BH93_9BACI|nr:tripartite tricarboxylate transporter TctB family protein [Alteribacillus iranensis]SFE54643.1 Tripartite tricarboxylate transporter TctB family protein [Alteribacillus iranensis]
MAHEIKNILFLLCIGTFAVVYYLDVRTLPEPEERNLVVLLLWGLGILLVIETSRSLIRGWRKRQEEHSSFFQDMKAWVMGKQAILLFGIIAYVIFVPIVGFFVTSFVFIVLLNYLLESRKAWELTVIPVILLILIYVLFSMFLGVELPRGFLV